MAQLHMYLPEELASEVRARADAAGQSVSTFLAGIVTRALGEGWPDGFFEEVVGGWRGEPLERAPQGTPERRDAL
jgi:hypothetical protein